MSKIKDKLMELSEKDEKEFEIAYRQYEIENDTSALEKLLSEDLTDV